MGRKPRNRQCPWCGGLMLWVNEFGKWRCENCNQYSPTTRDREHKPSFDTAPFVIVDARPVEPEKPLIPGALTSTRQNSGSVFPDAEWTGQVKVIHVVEGVNHRYVLDRHLVLFVEVFRERHGAVSYRRFGVSCSDIPIVGVGITDADALRNFGEEFEECWQSLIVEEHVHTEEDRELAALLNQIVTKRRSNKILVRDDAAYERVNPYFDKHSRHYTDRI